MLDETLARLDGIGKEASSTLEFPRTSYNRWLGTQDTLEKLNKLRGLLRTHFLDESQDIIQPLDVLAEAIYQSVYVSEEKTIGFRNPYLTGNPVELTRAVLFKGRMNLIERIIGILRSHSAVTFVLFGPRRMGKTSFLLQLPRLLPANYLPIFIDIQQGIAQSDAQFLYGLANAIYGQTKKFLDIQKPDIVSFEARPYFAINEWLEDLSPLINERILFFTIDEFEAIGEAIARGRMTVQILEYMRHLMQHNKNMVLLFAGVQTIDALGPNAASYFISAYPIEITYLAQDEAVELIKNPDPSAGQMPEYDKDVVEEIIRLTRCQPYLIQVICSEIIEIANKKGITRIQSAILAEAIQQVFMTSNYFKYIWDNAGPDGQKILKNIAGNPDVRLNSAKKPAMVELLRKHVLCKQDDQRYAIEIPLVEMWIRGQ